MLGARFRIVCLLALAIFVAQASRIADFVGDDECAGCCAGDDDDDRHRQCPPDCVACVCGVPVASVAGPAMPGLVVPIGELLPIAEDEIAMNDAEPRQIDHVPRRHG